MLRLSYLAAGLIFYIFAQVPLQAESIVSEGFKKFSSGGSSLALNTWSRQSRILTDHKRDQIASELKETEGTLGACTGFDILHTQNFGSKDTQVLAVAHFNYGSLFFRFLVFQDNLGQEYVNGVWFSLDPQEQVPSKQPSLIFPNAKPKP